MTIPPPLQESLKHSITSGSFVDTKFWVFSKRVGFKLVGRPKALFVNERVAKRVPLLRALLDERETEENLRDRFPKDSKPYTREYLYDDDSDLEDDDEEEISDDEPMSPPQVATEEPGNNSELTVIENPDGKNSKPSDIISISDLGSVFSYSPDAGKNAANSDPSAHVGKAIIIEDVAFVTFQAMLRYLYTNEIEFAPWGSAERREARARETISESYGIPKPSPKSIYRLADKYDIPELKKLAWRQLQRDQPRCNIVEEVFSEYTSWYPEIRELELRQLARELVSSNSGPTLRSLKEEIKRYAQGELPHAKHVIPALYNLTEGGGSIEETPLPVVASPNHDSVGGDWTGLKKALTTSLTSGTFLDTQLYAVESRTSAGPSKIRPIYFCSAVGGSFSSKLLADSSRLRPHKAKAPLQHQDDHDSDVNDKEPNQVNSTAELYPSLKCVRESPTPTDLPLDPALMLGSGAAKTWSAIFFYVYTGLITFTTISSHDKRVLRGDCPDDETKPPEDSEEPVTLPPDCTIVEPCSPKSIYRLAEKVGLTGLCATAFKVIQSQLDEGNIVQELFSPFTAKHKNVREMEHELFQSKLKPLVDRDVISDLIEGCSSGRHPHRAAAIELVLERSIQGLRERVSVKVKNPPRPASVPDPKRSNEAETTPVPELKPAAPAPTPQPKRSTRTADSPVPKAKPSAPAPQLSSSSGPLSLFGVAEASPLPKPAKKTKVARPDHPPADANANPLPSDVIVELVCEGCRVKHPRKSLWSNIYCPSCPELSDVMKCVRCGTIRTENVRTCTGCRGKIK